MPIDDVAVQVCGYGITPRRLAQDLLAMLGRAALPIHVGWNACLERATPFERAEDWGCGHTVFPSAAMTARPSQRTESRIL